MKKTMNFSTFTVLILSFLAPTAHTMDEPEIEDELEIVNECLDEGIFSSIPENLKEAVRHNERGSYIDCIVKTDFTDGGMPYRIINRYYLSRAGQVATHATPKPDDAANKGSLDFICPKKQ